MTQNDVYKLIRSMKTSKKVYEEDKFYSMNDKNILQFEYCSTDESHITFVCPKDDLGDFMLIEINEEGVHFTKISNGGSKYDEIDLSTEDSFFQTSTVMDLGFTHDDLHEIRMNFLKYYNGLIDGMTIFI